MTAVIYIRPKNRLAKLLSAPGGRKLKEAVAEAEANVLKMRDGIIGEVNQALERLQVAVDSAASGGGPKAHAEVYAQASGIAGLAGLCGEVRLGKVAYNLCELVDRYIEAGTWNIAAVETHLDTMTLLRAAAFPEDSADGDALLDALRDLVRRAERQQAENTGA